MSRKTYLQLLNGVGILSAGIFVALSSSTVLAKEAMPETPPLVTQPISSSTSADTEPASPETASAPASSDPASTAEPTATNDTATGKMTIVDIAAQGEKFKTLTAALKAAGLTDTLNGEGPFTVFAPTDEAFAKLPAGTVDELLKPENKDALVQILTYHVVPGAVSSTDLKSGDVKTVEGQSVAIKVGKSGVTVNDAQVTTADIKARNGVIHVIDQVLRPSQSQEATTSMPTVPSLPIPSMPNPSGGVSVPGTTSVPGVSQ
jgi:uncharacterized surface protein with fasciclin (FAS1) repeats